MGKHNDKEFSDNIKNHIRNSLQEQLSSGLAQGLYAACKVVRDKATADGKSPDDRLNDIVEFCNIIIDGPGSPAQKENA